MPAPYWTTYPEAIALAGGVSISVPTDEPSGFRVTVEQLEAARTERTKALLFVSPSNPTGAVYPRPTRWRPSAGGPLEHGIWVVTDEIYEHLVYGDATVPSMPVVVPELADRCVVLNGVAKTYAMTGWRVGWMIGPPDVIEGGHEPPVALDVQRQQRRAARHARRRRRRPGCGRRDARGVRPPPPRRPPTAVQHRRRHVRGARGRVLRVPQPQVPISRPLDPRPNRLLDARAGGDPSRRGAGGHRPRRGVRRAGLRPALVRPRRRRPGRGDHADRRPPRRRLARPDHGTDIGH